MNGLREQFATFTHPQTTQHESRRLGLALGGGGGKAAAHLGILQVLNELDIPIDLMVGASFVVGTRQYTIAYRM